MASYMIAVADDLDAELQRFVAQYNRTKDPDDPEIDAVGALELFVLQKLLRRQRDTRFREWSTYRRAYEQATPEQQAAADAALRDAALRR